MKLLQAAKDPFPRQSALATPVDKAYFPALDGVRAVAFLMVFGVHYLQIPWGWAGVDVFFVLSGFLITGILFDSRDDPNRVHNFYVRRTLRIFPLYYGVILLLVLTYPLFKWEWTWLWLVWPMYLGNFAWYLYPFIHGRELQMLADAQPLSSAFPHIQLFFGHFWSLCVEEQFYLVWPWIVFSIRSRRKLIAICIAAIVICPLLRVLGSHILPLVVLRANTLITATPLRIDALLLGGVTALVRRGPHARQMHIFARALFCIMLATALLWLILDPTSGLGAREFRYPSWSFTWGISFIDIFSTCIITMALEFRSLTFRLFNLRPLRWMGRISYGLYVFHDIPHTIYNSAARHFFGQGKYPPAILGFACTLLFASISFRFFEKPFIDLKERWTRQ